MEGFIFDRSMPIEVEYLIVGYIGGYHQFYMETISGNLTITRYSCPMFYKEFTKELSEGNCEAIQGFITFITGSIDRFGQYEGEESDDILYIQSRDIPLHVLIHAAMDSGKVYSLRCVHFFLEAMSNEEGMRNVENIIKSHTDGKDVIIDGKTYDKMVADGIVVDGCFSSCLSSSVIRAYMMREGKKDERLISKAIRSDVRVLQHFSEEDLSMIKGSPTLSGALTACCDFEGVTEWIERLGIPITRAMSLIAASVGNLAIFRDNFKSPSLLSELGTISRSLHGSIIRGSGTLSILLLKAITPQIKTHTGGLQLLQGCITASLQLDPDVEAVDHLKATGAILDLYEEMGTDKKAISCKILRGDIKEYVDERMKRWKGPSYIMDFSLAGMKYLTVCDEKYILSVVGKEYGKMTIIDFRMHAGLSPQVRVEMAKCIPRFTVDDIRFEISTLRFSSEVFNVVASRCSQSLSIEDFKYIIETEIPESCICGLMNMKCFSKIVTSLNDAQQTRTIIYETRISCTILRSFINKKYRSAYRTFLLVTKVNPTHCLQISDATRMISNDWIEEFAAISGKKMISKYLSYVSSEKMMRYMAGEYRIYTIYSYVLTSCSPLVLSFFLDVTLPSPIVTSKYMRTLEDLRDRNMDRITGVDYVKSISVLESYMSRWTGM